MGWGHTAAAGSAVGLASALATATALLASRLCTAASRHADASSDVMASACNDPAIAFTSGIGDTPDARAAAMAVSSSEAAGAVVCSLPAPDAPAACTRPTRSLSSATVALVVATGGTRTGSGVGAGAAHSSGRVMNPRPCGAGSAAALDRTVHDGTL